MYSGKSVISISGEASVKVPMDVTVVTFTISGREKTNKKATNVLTKQNNAVVDVVTGLGIDRKDLNTGSMKVRPVWDYYDDRNKDESYEYSVDYTIRFPNDNVLLSRIMKALRNIEFVTCLRFRFECSDRDAVRNTVLADATRNALEKARAITVAAGVMMGPILSINEGSGSRYGRDDYMMLASKNICCDYDEDVRVIDVEPSDATVSASVSLEIEIINP